MSRMERGPIEAASLSYVFFVGEADGVGIATTCEKPLKSEKSAGMVMSGTARRVGGLAASTLVVRGWTDAHSFSSSMSEPSKVVDSCLARALIAARPAILRRDPPKERPRLCNEPTLPNILRPVLRSPSPDEGGEGSPLLGDGGCPSSRPLRAKSEMHLSWTFDTGGG